MIHTRFLGNNKTVCEDPQRLGNDFVAIDFRPGDVENCKTCNALLFAHNEREFQQDLANRYGVTVLEADDRKGCIGVVGMIGLSLFWIAIALIVWAVFFRG